jgi:hypothetical protein
MAAALLVGVLALAAWPLLGPFVQATGAMSKLIVQMMPDGVLGLVALAPHEPAALGRVVLFLAYAWLPVMLPWALFTVRLARRRPRPWPQVAVAVLAAPVALVGLVAQLTHARDPLSQGLVLAVSGLTVGGIARGSRVALWLVPLSALWPSLLLIEHHSLVVEAALGHDVFESGACRATADRTYRPEGFSGTRGALYSVTPTASGVALVTGLDGVGAWISYTPDGRPVGVGQAQAWGNYWRGCELDGRLWLVNRSGLYGVTVPTLGPDGLLARRDDVREVQDLGLPESLLCTGEVDLLYTACDTGRGHVYVSEQSCGGLLRYTPATGRWDRVPDVGVYLTRADRSGRGDGLHAWVTTGRVRVFDPAQGYRRLSETHVALTKADSEGCPLDGRVAVSDPTGRVRVYAPESDPARGYRYLFGVDVDAPRKLAWSDDCAQIGVVSGNDREMAIIDAGSGRVACTRPTGPGSRGIAPVPRVSGGGFAVVSACGVTTYRCQ